MAHYISRFWLLTVASRCKRYSESIEYCTFCCNQLHLPIHFLHAKHRYKKALLIHKCIIPFLILRVEWWMIFDKNGIQIHSPKFNLTTQFQWVIQCWAITVWASKRARVLSGREGYEVLYPKLDKNNPLFSELLSRILPFVNSSREATTKNNQFCSNLSSRARFASAESNLVHLSRESDFMMMRRN